MLVHRKVYHTQLYDVRTGYALYKRTLPNIYISTSDLSKTKCNSLVRYAVMLYYVTAPWIDFTLLGFSWYTMSMLTPACRTRKLGIRNVAIAVKGDFMR